MQTLIIACSGDGAGTATFINVLVSKYCAAAGGTMTAAILYDAWRNRRFGLPARVAPLLLALHPAWIFSATGGDCGMMMVGASYVATAIFIGLLVIQSVIPRTRRTLYNDNGSPAN